MEEMFVGFLIVAFLFVAGCVYTFFLKGSNSQSTDEGNVRSNQAPQRVTNFPDRFESLEDLQAALRSVGLESSNLILGIDYTKSNLSQGTNSFYRQSLHKTDFQVARRSIMNPYQQVISIIGKTLQPFDDDNIIPTFGFGDIYTADKNVFPFFPDRDCLGFEEVLERYKQITPSIKLSGPTSFAPIIHKAIDIVKHTKKYHILVIIADGCVTTPNTTRQAIVQASNYPLSIICVGVGDGPFDLMHEFDDQITNSKFDNFQFVEFNEAIKNCENIEVEFARRALMEIPDQFNAIKTLGYLE